MALPAQLQQKRDEMEQDQMTRTKPEPSAVKEIPKPEAEEKTEDATPETTPTAEQINLSREEYTELRELADKAKAAEGRAEAIRQDLDAMKQHLTELETGSKDGAKSTSKQDRWNVEAPQFTPDEEESYGDSKDYIQKVVRGVLAEVLPNYFSEISTQIDSIEQTAKNASDAASNTRVGSFTDRVRSKVPDFDACVDNPAWASFVQAVEPTSGMSYADLIRNNLSKENLPGMENIFNEFKRRYKIGQADASGYEGAVPSGAAADVPSNQRATILKFSDRKAAHDKYLRKEITYEAYQQIKQKFDEADRVGQIDYDA